jgi:hypothetical protein
MQQSAFQTPRSPFDHREAFFDFRKLMVGTGDEGSNLIFVHRGPAGCVEDRAMRESSGRLPSKRAHGPSILSAPRRHEHSGLRQ